MVHLEDSRTLARLIRIHLAFSERINIFPLWSRLLWPPHNWCSCITSVRHITAQLSSINMRVCLMWERFLSITLGNLFVRCNQQQFWWCFSFMNFLIEFLSQRLWHFYVWNSILFEMIRGTTYPIMLLDMDKNKTIFCYKKTKSYFKYKMSFEGENFGATILRTLKIMYFIIFFTKSIFFIKGSVFKTSLKFISSVVQIWNWNLQISDSTFLD